MIYFLYGKNTTFGKITLRVSLKTVHFHLFFHILLPLTSLVRNTINLTSPLPPLLLWTLNFLLRLWISRMSHVGEVLSLCRFLGRTNSYSIGCTDCRLKFRPWFSFSKCVDIDHTSSPLTTLNYPFQHSLTTFDQVVDCRFQICRYTPHIITIDHSGPFFNNM